MRTLSFCIVLFCLTACGGSTEPKFSGGLYELIAVNGDAQAMRFDTTHCASVYDNLITSIRLSGGAQGTATYHARAHPYCSAQQNVWDDTGGYTLAGDAVAIKFARASVTQSGTLSANRDTLSIDLRDVFTLDNPETTRFAFVRSH